MRDTVLHHWRALGQADMASIVLLVLFVLVVFGLESWLQPQFTPTSLLIVGVIAALIPAIIWLAFFYRRDRLEPEPKGMVLQLFLLQLRSKCLATVRPGQRPVHCEM